MGINRLQDPILVNPTLIVDVDFEGIRKKASDITSVSGVLVP